MSSQEKPSSGEKPEISPYFAKRWKFVNRLQGGGQADPYIVRDLQSGEMGVLKQPKWTSDIAKARLRREIAAVQDIKHPAIVQLLDYTLDENEIGYVSPLGQVLRDYWKEKRQSLRPTELYDLAYSFMASLADGLALAHAKGIVHRDLKAANVIVKDTPIGPQAVLIDFGLSFREGEERLSIIDGRLVHNLDTSPAESYYRHIDPTPAWDCIGLGWLYGYLIGAGFPQNNRFHWKFHPLVEEARATRARALLAQCSDLDYAPIHAAGFRKVLDELGLGGSTVRAPKSAVDFTAAEAALRNAKAASQIRWVEQAEQYQVLRAAYGQRLTELRAELRQLVAQASGLPIVETNLSQTSRPFDEHFKIAFKGDDPHAEPFFWVICGSHPGTHFYICGFLEYEPRQKKSGDTLFNLRFDCRHSGNLWNLCERFFFARDGSAYSKSQSGHGHDVSNADIVAIITEWLQRTSHWSAVG